MPIRTSIDVLPSKNQVLYEYFSHGKQVKNTADTLISIFPIKSCEKGLITKEHTVMDMNLFLNGLDISLH